MKRLSKWFTLSSLISECICVYLEVLILLLMIDNDIIDLLLVNSYQLFSFFAIYFDN
jgi:hypothetical protein